ncbi:pantoate--beta-alanine ligase [Bacillus niameyensis]|uniref:pantoate--beta-alanine ligase n=1 Tax=Bacillus niameyensis TaxID=1522308 RepID=UPI000783BA0B|nr:pantoate--beta-alanine ligase [Bacillus niameyensis]
MEIIKTKAEMQKRAKELRKSGNSVGFVPTMGFLHEGHLQLAHRSIQENEITVMSIFVNPLQFGPEEDFEAYPRDSERDQLLAENAGVDILFMPDHSNIYNQEASFEIKVNKRTDVLCGKSRPGHFDGVSTILIKLFNIIIPDKVYMGLKDAQQVAVVDSLIHYFDFPIELITVETVRETDGLARSSRNVYLSDEERKEARQLYQALKLGETLIQNGERNPQIIIAKVSEYIKKNITGTIDYVEIFSFPDLTVLKSIERRIILALAVKFSKARLIDNILIEVEK